MTPIPFREQNITYNPPLLSTLLAFTAHAAGHSSDTAQAAVSSRPAILRIFIKHSPFGGGTGAVPPYFSSFKIARICAAVKWQIN